MIFLNKQIDLFECNTTKHGVIVNNPRLANKLNALLKYYDCKIKDGEEPVFKFDNTKLSRVLIVLGLGSLK